MAEIKLFRLNSTVEELKPSEVALERNLQTCIEKNMQAFFGVRFLRSEYPIANGRMDSIGIDENNCPVIFEYKRSVNENVINQGLFYLSWLLDHKDSFKILVLETLGAEATQAIDWSAPCVICIARDFTKYDLHAVEVMRQNIKLVKYKKYDDGLILFEHLNAPNVQPTGVDVPPTPEPDGHGAKTHVEKVATSTPKMRALYEDVCSFIESLGDMTSNQLKFYLAYKKTQNFACIEIYKDKIILELKLCPDTVELEEGFTRDMRGIGHYGTGDLQVAISNTAALEKAKPLLERAYNEA